MIHSVNLSSPSYQKSQCRASDHEENGAAAEIIDIQETRYQHDGQVVIPINAPTSPLGLEGDRGQRTQRTLNNGTLDHASSTSNSFHTRPAYQEHLGNHRQYWRDIILGVNDGLVSTFLLVAGVSGGGLQVIDILLTAIAGGIAGAISMAAGEWIATKSQNEVLAGEIKLENKHIRKYKADELMELKELLQKIGLDSESNREADGDLFERVVEHYRNDNDALLKCMMALEFGVIEEERRSPWKAGAYSFFLFVLGSLPSIIPFIVVVNPLAGLIAAAIATGICLLIVGAAKTFATRGKWYEAALENLLVAAGGGAIAYGIGLGFEKITRV